MAMRTVRAHVEKETIRARFPFAAKEVLMNKYVDDIHTGGDTEEEVIQLQQDLIQLFQEGGWVLMKFASNSRKVLQSIPESRRLPGQVVDLDQGGEDGENIAKTLGLRWDTVQDVLLCNSSEQLCNSVKVITKRGVLSKVSCIYDLFGFFAPFVIRGKLMIQQLWKAGCSWDAECPDLILQEFREWEAELPMLEKIQIPRWFGTTTKIGQVQLHGFADASERAYGAMIFLRYELKGKTCSTFIIAKTKVAPLKAKSLARLELMAAYCLANLTSYVEEALNQQVERVQLWSDSEIVLAWLAKESTQWKTFVRNRVQEIQDLTGIQGWRHCPSKDNPADILSRGLRLAELKASKLYWHGPEWLVESEDKWPNVKLGPTPPQVDEERVKEVCLPIDAQVSYPSFFLRYRSFSRLARLVAWILRWRHGKLKGPIHQEELHNAKMRVLSLIQSQHFPAEIYLLRAGKSLPSSSRLLPLNPCLEVNTGLLIARGRLKRSSLVMTAQNPVILPNSDPVVWSLILDAHLRGQHATHTTTLAILREEFAIIHSRSEVRRALKTCLICKHYKAKAETQIMGELPSERVTVAPAFSHIGLDYTGPVYLREKGCPLRKAYIVVFTCMASRMVHFEIAQDMSAEEFLLALRRMFARRGVCRTIFSDNAKYFKKADKVLSSSVQRLASLRESPEVQAHLAEHRIEWKFIAERSAFRGGAWERINRSLKEPMRKILGKALLNYSEMATVLADVEASLNQRPLTWMFEGEVDPPLTPAHLALGRSLYTLPDTHNSKEVTVTKRYLYLQNLMNQCWKRWTLEYLPSLLPRQKWKSERPILSLNDVVYVTEENTKRGSWPLGRIVATIPSKDGLVRTYKIQTSRGVITRPIQRLILLESWKSNEDVMQKSEGRISEVGLDDPRSYQGGECIDSPTSKVAPSSPDCSNPSQFLDIQVPAGNPEVNTKKTRAGRLVKLPQRYLE